MAGADEEQSIEELALSLPANAVVGRALMDMVIRNGNDETTDIPTQEFLAELLKGVVNLEMRVIQLEERLKG